MKSDLSDSYKGRGHWTRQEHDLFLKGQERYGRKWSMYTQLIPTRTTAQIRSHAQKYMLKKGDREVKNRCLYCDSQSSKVTEDVGIQCDFVDIVLDDCTKVCSSQDLDSVSDLYLSSPDTTDSLYSYMPSPQL